MQQRPGFVAMPQLPRERVLPRLQRQQLVFDRARWHASASASTRWRMRRPTRASSALSPPPSARLSLQPVHLRGELLARARLPQAGRRYVAPRPSRTVQRAAAHARYAQLGAAEAGAAALAARSSVRERTQAIWNVVGEFKWSTWRSPGR